MQDMDVVVDGTDNFESRFILNDCAVKLSKPWVFAGVLGMKAQVMTIVPGKTACLRCLMDCTARTGRRSLASRGPGCGRRRDGRIRGLRGPEGPFRPPRLYQSLLDGIRPVGQHSQADRCLHAAGGLPLLRSKAV